MNRQAIMDKDFTLGEAARTIGVSVDTLRRWDRAGKLRTHRDEDNRRMVPAAEVRRLRAVPERHRTGARLSARNRMLGRVLSIESDGVMALIEIEAGPFLLTAAVTRDSVEDLELQVGDEVVACVKATSMMVEKR
jgi:molybdopterin-binding protein